MGDKNWMPDFDFEFPEIIEERESYVEKCRDIKEVAIFPHDLLITPFEFMTLQVSDPKLKQMLDDADKDEVYPGMGFREKDEKALPAVGSIGVGFDIDEIDKKSVRGTYIVKIRGVVRFTLDEYLETDKSYSVARITFFEDERPENKVEREMLPGLQRELKELLGIYNRKLGRWRHMDDASQRLDDKYMEAWSFFFWFIFAPVPMKLRNMLLETRSTVKRLYLLTNHMKRVLPRLDSTTSSKFN